MGRAHEVRAASMAKTAAAKSKNNAKHARLIYMAAKEGVADINANSALKNAVDRAKKDNVSNDVIARAIERAKGGTDDSYVETRYEGFGPNNLMFIVECFTDNPNRSYVAVRTAVNKAGYKLGQDGSVTCMFTQKAIFSFEGEAGQTADDVAMELLEAGAPLEDVTEEEGLITVVGDPHGYKTLTGALNTLYPETKLLEDHIAWVPLTPVKITDPKAIEHFARFKAALDEIEDVQDLFSNGEFDAE